VTLAAVGLAFAQEARQEGEKKDAAQEPVKQENTQENTEKKEPVEELPKLEIPDLSGRQDAQQEMIRLFHEVEHNLESIDVELADAGAGRIPIPEGRDSGIERLLRAHGEKSDQVVAGMDKILELAQQMGGKSGSCMKSSMQPQPEQGGQSPLDKERQHGPTEGEKTPEAPKPDPKGQKPMQPQEQSEKPDDKGQNPPNGENRPSPPRSDAGGTPVAPGNDAERWGLLPERVRNVFQNQITDDLPLQYRDWIDSYYRRLNTSR
jgi:hypothetical protein